MAPDYSREHGYPIWLHIPATDVQRARNFYTELLNFQFRTGEKADMERDTTAHFMYAHPTLNDDKMWIGGAIMKTRAHEKIVDDTYASATGKISPTQYFAVDDLQASMKKAEQLGGRVLVGETAEGEHGMYAVLQDTEGNALGIHYTKPAA